MESLPVLKFEPILKSIVWGGRNLSHVMGRKLPTDDPYGESWELCDLAGNQSRVADGPFAGQSIEALIAQYPVAFLGRASLLDERFPLLFKFIDAQDTLSVQVHPDAQTCKQLQGGARPKTEAWYIIHCTPEAKLYVGLKNGVTRAAFEASLKDGSVEKHLNQKSVSPGDYIFLPSGTVHAIGKGIVLAEVQQSSNTTYRVFDWNRVGFDGNPRELHVQQALASTHFDEFGEPTITPPTSGRKGVLCAYFSMETVRIDGNNTATFSSKGPIIVMGTKGNGVVTVTAGEQKVIFQLGETIVIPACIAENVTLTGTEQLDCVVTQIP